MAGIEIDTNCHLHAQNKPNHIKNNRLLALTLLQIETASIKDMRKTLQVCCSVSVEEFFEEVCLF